MMRFLVIFFATHVSMMMEQKIISKNTFESMHHICSKMMCLSVYGTVRTCFVRNMFLTHHFELLSISIIFWNKRCLNHGILSHKKSEKLLIIVTERKRRQRLGITGSTSASKSNSKSNSSSPAPPKKKKAKIKKESGGASPVKSANL